MKDVIKEVEKGLKELGITEERDKKMFSGILRRFSGGHGGGSTLEE